MNTEKILKIINQVRDNLNEIEGELNIVGVSKKEIQKNKPQTNKKRNKGIDLTQPIKKLYDDKFFSDHQTDLDVKNKLELDLLTDKSPKRPSIVNVLRKMVKSGLLVRGKISKGKKTIIGYKNKS
jgi:hypothetical protein